MTACFKRWTYDATPFFSLAGTRTWARVVDVYDGDTCTLVLPLKDDFFKFQCRMHGIDTCELKDRDQEYKQRAQAARARLVELVTGSRIPASDALELSRGALRFRLSETDFLVFTECLEFDKYGRLLVRLYSDDAAPDSLATMLIREGLGVEYDGGTKRIKDPNED